MPGRRCTDQRVGCPDRDGRVCTIPVLQVPRRFARAVHPLSEPDCRSLLRPPKVHVKAGTKAVSQPAGQAYAGHGQAFGSFANRKSRFRAA